MQRNVFMFQEVLAPYHSVMAILRDQPGLVLAPAALVSLGGANEVVARLDGRIGGVTVAEDVDVLFGSFEEVDRGMNACIREVSWHAVDHPEWFPRFSGEFEAYPLSPDRTQLTFVGRYTPPGGLLGGVVDLVAFHRIADSTLRSFFDVAAQRLVEVAAPTPAP